MKAEKFETAHFNLKLFLHSLCPNDMSSKTADTEQHSRNKRYFMYST